MCLKDDFFKRLSRKIYFLKHIYYFWTENQSVLFSMNDTLPNNSSKLKNPTDCYKTILQANKQSFNQSFKHRYKQIRFTRPRLQRHTLRYRFVVWEPMSVHPHSPSGGRCGARSLLSAVGEVWDSPSGNASTGPAADPWPTDGAWPSWLSAVFR